MIKEGQSLLEFINFLPLQAVVRKRAPLTNKEAQALYTIWEGDKDRYGNILVPDDVDPMAVASLTTKGIIQSKPSMAAVLGGLGRAVEITRVGKEIIRNIILYSEKNAFEKQSSKAVDYESIYVAIADGPDIKASGKNKVAWRANWIKKAQKSYVGSCTEDEVVENYFGDATVLAQTVENGQPIDFEQFVKLCTVHPNIINEIRYNPRRYKFAVDEDIAWVYDQEEDIHYFYI